MDTVADDIFRGLTVLSLEQATVLPYLTFRLAQDGVRIIRLEHPVMCDPNRMIGEPFLRGRGQDEQLLLRHQLREGSGDPEPERTAGPGAAASG